MDGSVKLKDLALLKTLNNKEGWIVKIFKKKKLCGVQLEAGHIITVQFKNIECSEPKEKPTKEGGEGDLKKEEGGEGEPKKEQEGEGGTGWEPLKEHDTPEGAATDGGDGAGVLPGEYENAMSAEESAQQAAGAGGAEAQLAQAATLGRDPLDLNDDASVASSALSHVAELLGFADSVGKTSVAGSQTSKLPSMVGSVGKTSVVREAPDLNDDTSVAGSAVSHAASLVGSVFDIPSAPSATGSQTSKPPSVAGSAGKNLVAGLQASKLPSIAGSGGRMAATD